MDNIIAIAYKILFKGHEDSRKKLFTEQEIESAVSRAMIAWGTTGPEADQQKAKIVRIIQTRVNVAVSSSVAIYGTDSTNWLTNERIEQDLKKKGFWNRYKRYLEEERTPEELRAVDNDTNNILGVSRRRKCGAFVE